MHFIVCVLLASRGNEAANQWLEEHPAVLGGGAILLAAALIGFGVKALLTGESSGKWGVQLEGGMAKAHGGILAGFGLLVLLFGIYKLISAVL